MRPEARDAAYLWDMLDAARTIRGFVKGLHPDDYLRDRRLQFAVERAIEIIGEAARRVSAPFRDAHPEVPWRLLVAQRNVLAHEYGEVKQERIWVVASKHVPDLIAVIEPLVPAEPPG